MRAAAIQLHPPGPDPNLQFVHAASMVRLAASSGAELIVLPELSALPVDSKQDEVAAASQTFDGFLTSRFSRLAQECNCIIAFGYPELHNGSLKNSFGVVGPSGHMSNAQKANLFGWDNTWALGSELTNPILALPTMRIGILIGRDVMNVDLRTGNPIYLPGSVDVILLPTRWVGEYSFPDSAWVDLGRNVGCSVVVSNIVSDGIYAKHRGGVCVIDRCGRISLQGLVPGGDCFVLGDI